MIISHQLPALSWSWNHWTPGPWRPLSTQGSQRIYLSFASFPQFFPKHCGKKGRWGLWRKTHFLFKYKADIFFHSVLIWEAEISEFSGFINHYPIKFCIRWRVILRLFCFVGCGTFYLQPPWLNPSRFVFLSASPRNMSKLDLACLSNKIVPAAW